ncbi:hypothetical protein QJS10_CPA03g01381 [Acorus calamus]|uniref:Uncharacterized protein n=1 Tax=Acorus calamus TaxID=4465 RepID=A0AAV9F752_ACOCL|nr:hypothetical protein QJS10_CPA03g01381 [Acorus calamus]
MDEEKISTEGQYLEGKNINMWYDPWIKGKSLAQIFGRVSYDWGPPKEATVVAFITEDKWVKPHRTSEKLDMIWSNIQQIDVHRDQAFSQSSDLRCSSLKESIKLRTLNRVFRIIQSLKLDAISSAFGVQTEEKERTQAKKIAAVNKECTRSRDPTAAKTVMLGLSWRSMKSQTNAAPIMNMQSDTISLRNQSPSGLIV